ncbi:peroxisomal leader peptide-processing protease [Megalopta genalis]|uniref:peroxisomal leader peptide-processing protease n=1 Tax=Megalopta genalis TaxID=115081 RepID=UPI0014437A31|nr:peroxisomal leader peptide-processing protease [Megalopta genalis]XP_033330488.1 peroxisomal leader peptide-processing protease [Megalopta genalis]
MDAAGSVFISERAATTTDETIFSHGYSGIPIAKRWVLAHGSVLSRSAERSRQILDFVDASSPGELTLLEPYGQLFGDVTFLIRRDHDSSTEHWEGKPFALWKCALLSDTMKSLSTNWSFRTGEKFDRAFLPVLLLIARSSPTPSLRTGDQLLCESSDNGFTGRRRRGETAQEDEGEIGDILLGLAKESAIGAPAKGSTVEIFSTPFGNPFFSNTVARGIVGNLLGKKECLMLIDAAVFPGCQGAPVYSFDNRARKTVCGMVIASSCWCRGERIDYTFAINLQASLNELLVRGSISSPVLLSARGTDRNDKIGILERSIAIVRCGPNWGTGILLDDRTGTFITCAHVVARAPETRIELASHIASRRNKSEWTAEAKLIYKTPDNKPYDIAVLKMDLKCKETSMKAIKLADRPVMNGEPILSIGFPFCSTAKATISNGIISKSSRYMLQTNCYAQSGVSGGPIVRPASLEMLGMIVCNTVSSSDETAYPRLSMAIPTNIFKGPLDHYLRTTDPKALENLTQRDEIIAETWNFRSPFLRSNM